jgi:hypothetical protein
MPYHLKRLSGETLKSEYDVREQPIRVSKNDQSGVVKFWMALAQAYTSLSQDPACSESGSTGFPVWQNRCLSMAPESALPFGGPVVFYCASDLRHNRVIMRPIRRYERR